QVFLNKGDGTFDINRVKSFPLSQRAMVENVFTAADLNGDGKLDLIGGVDSPAVAVMMGNGDGTFATSVETGTDENTGYATPTSISIADFVGNGQLGVAASAYHKADVLLPKCN